MINISQQQGGANSPTNMAGLLATVTGIDLKATAATNLYTVPTGKTLIVTEVVIRVTAVDTFISGATIEVGKSAGYDEWLVATAMGALSAVNQYRMLSHSAAGLIYQSFAAGDVLALNVTVGAVSTTLTAAADVFGYLI